MAQVRDCVGLFGEAAFARMGLRENRQPYDA
jgi:hypothetical protein